MHGVMHRDLKPENFLFANKKESSPLKAIDFGLSVFFKPGKLSVCFNFSLLPLRQIIFFLLDYFAMIIRTNVLFYNRSAVYRDCGKPLLHGTRGAEEELRSRG